MLCCVGGQIRVCGAVAPTGTHKQADRLPCLPGDTGFFMPDKARAHYSLPSEMTQEFLRLALH